MFGMKSHSSLAKYDASCLVQPRAEKPCTTQFIVENQERLPFVASAKPLFDRLISRASAVLRRIPCVMQDFSNHSEASAMK